jgi:hypothetical protein
MREIINLTEGVDVEKLVGDVRDQAVAEYGISGLQGQCEGIALELYDALTEGGINADFVFGRYAQPYLHDGETFEQTPHCWVETGDLILDPSHEQFGNNMLIIDKKSPAAKKYNKETVYISEEHDYEQWEPKHGIDDFVRVEFNTGGCYELAVALNAKTGWPVYGRYDKHGDLDHAWVVAPGNRAVDVNGIHDGPVAITPYDTIPVKGKPLPKGSEGINAEMLEWANQLIQHFPDYFGVGR